MWSVQKLVYWGGTLLFCLISILLYYPGSMGNDSLSQWYQVNGVFAISDWHPPIMVHLWSVLNKLVEGPASLLILQHVLYWIGLALLIDTMVQVRAKTVKILALAIIGFFPVVWFSMASVWKDALMISTLIFAVGLYTVLRNQSFHNQLLKASLALIIWTTLILACGLRHNALLAVLPLVFMMTYDYFPRYGWLKKWTLGASLFLSIFLMSRASNRLGVEKHYPYLVNQLVFWNLAGLSIDTDEMLIPAEAFLEQDSANLHVIQRYYNDASNNNLIFSSGIINPNIWGDEAAGSEFFGTGLTIIGNYPIEYLKMRCRFLKEFSGLDRWMPYAAFIFKTNYWQGDEKLGIPMYRMRNSGFLNFLEEKVARKLSHFGFFNVIPYFFILISVVMLLTLQAIKRKEHPRNRIYLGLALSGLLYWVPYVFIAPSNDFRYHLWTIQIVVVILVIEGINIIHNRLKTEK